MSAIALVALIAGIYGRFRGLSTAPLAVDEYYLLRSTDNVLRTGWPEYACGGWYTRGVLLQYFSALVRVGGVSAVLAPRIICVISSLLALPAAFILGCRAHGRAVGILALSLLAVSVWEIEIGRFGRMYAPFQTVFLWYLVFFIKFTIDRNTRALWPMAALSIAGPLLWEGGALLGLANFLAVYLRWLDNRLSRADKVYLVVAAVLFAAAYWFVTTDFRAPDELLALPANYEATMETAYPDAFNSIQAPQGGLRHHPAWMALGLVPLGAALFALRWVWTWRRRPLSAAGLFAALAAGLVGQFAALGVVVLLLVLLRQLTWRDLSAHAARPFQLAVASCVFFWLAFAVLALPPHDSAPTTQVPRALVTAYQFLRFPDLVNVIVRPWSRAVPILGSGLLLLIGAAVARVTRDDRQSLSAGYVLLVVLLCLLFAASSSSPPRLETRYVFFLYPVAIVVALATIAQLADLLPVPRALGSALAVGVTLGGFALTEDFQPRHLLHIDSNAAALRQDLDPRQISHLVAREDTPAIARWLQQHANHEGDVVITSYHSLDYYYPGVAYFFTDWHDPNFTGWSCARGTLERWTNLPLLYTTDALKAKIAAGGRAFLVVFNYQRDELLPALAPWHPEVTWSGVFVSVIALPRQYLRTSQ